MDEIKKVNQSVDPTWDPIKDALKEIGRYLIFGVIAEVVIVIIPVVMQGINTSTGEIKINWAMVLAIALVTALTAILRGLDKWKHQRTKILSPLKRHSPNGLLPF